MEEQAYLRAHLRLDVVILLQYRTLSAEEREALANAQLSNNHQDCSHHVFSLQPFIADKDKEDELGDINPFIINSLIDINLKLNLVLTMLSGERETSIFTQQPKAVNLSEGGIGFTTKDHFKEGDIIELKMLLPVFPLAIITVWGKIVRVDHLPEGDNSVGVQFINIKEEDQDKIVHYLFKKQREELRIKKKEHSGEKFYEKD